jgi:hypothetical protein
MYQKYFLIITALLEGGIGLLLLISPSIPQRLLLALIQLSPESEFFGRFTGASLLALGVACWLGRDDHGRPSQPGLLAALLVYNVLAIVLLAFAGLVFSPIGIALWPAVVVHFALAIWNGLCLR